LIELLPEPCALLSPSGNLELTNAQWRDVFIATGLGSELIEACRTLFAWDADVWAGLEVELGMLLRGELVGVSFEARLAEPPDRWAVSSIAANTRSGGFIWQLTDVTRWQLTEAETQRLHQQFRDAVDSITDGFALYDADDRLVFCNRRYREIYAQSADLMTPGRSFAEILRKGAERGQYVAAMGRIEEWLAERVRWHQALETVEQQLSDGRWIRSIDRRTADGGIVGIRTDITAEKQAEELRRQSEAQDEMLRAQDVLLAELSTPLLRISEGSLVLPLIGAIDSSRAQRVVESLLNAVDAQRAELVILDITGVPVVDTQVANVLLQCARAVRLLGASMILTGIRPDVAQTIVALGIDLSDIITRADLREGIAYALKRR
jgi:anti-anti-sigma factor